MSEFFPNISTTTGLAYNQKIDLLSSKTKLYVVIIFAFEISNKNNAAKEQKHKVWNVLNESRVLKSFIIVMPSFIYQKDNSCTYNWEGTSSLCLDHLEFVEKWQLEAANLQNYYISLQHGYEVKKILLVLYRSLTMCVLDIILCIHRK